MIFHSEEHLVCQPEGGLLSKSYEAIIVKYNTSDITFPLSMNCSHSPCSLQHPFSVRMSKLELCYKDLVLSSMHLHCPLYKLVLILLCNYDLISFYMQIALSIVLGSPCYHDFTFISRLYCKLQGPLL